MAKPVRPRQGAVDDIADALDYYLDEAGDDVAERFVAAVERAMASIGRTPRSGSLRFAWELDSADLRYRPLMHFP